MFVLERRKLNYIIQPLARIGFGCAVVRVDEVLRGKFTEAKMCQAPSTRYASTPLSNESRAPLSNEIWAAEPFQNETPTGAAEVTMVQFEAPARPSNRSAQT